MKAIFKKIFILFLMSFSLTVCSAFAITPVQEQLTRIENEMWGLTYDKESDNERLDRIEKQVFGVSNPKLTSEKRVDKISKSLGIETYAEAKSSLSDLYVPQAAGQGVEYPQVDAIEQALLGSVYKSDHIYKRLERLEKKVFGAKQEGDLSQRTEALKRHANIASAEYPKEQSKQKQNYSSSFDESDMKIQLSAIENMVFGVDFSTEPVQLRLNRLENRIFQRGFEDDDNSTRVARLQAAATAKKTAKYYDNNKFQKFTSTGLQAASFILMILALIL